jgi:hypothetical protein
VQAERFSRSPSGVLVPIHAVDLRCGAWEHLAFAPHPLPQVTPELSVRTFNSVARARAALAALSSSARQLPNPGLLRRPTLRREAQSTSALEGTYAPLQDVLAADEEDEPEDANLREVMNFVRAAEHAFGWQAEGRPLTSGCSWTSRRGSSRELLRTRPTLAVSATSRWSSARTRALGSRTPGSCRDHLATN